MIGTVQLKLILRTLQIGLASLIAVSNLNPTSTIQDTARLADTKQVQAAVAEVRTANVRSEQKAQTLESRFEDSPIVELIKQESTKNGVDADLALDIATCESSLRQFETDGSVVRGKANPKDVGLFQINEEYHLKKSQELGFDIYTAKGNIDYAMYLMKTQGSKPWHWSKGCWVKSQEA